MTERPSEAVPGSSISTIRCVDRLIKLIGYFSKAKIVMHACMRVCRFSPACSGLEIEPRTRQPGKCVRCGHTVLRHGGRRWVFDRCRNSPLSIRYEISQSSLLWQPWSEARCELGTNEWGRFGGHTCVVIMARNLGGHLNFNEMCVMKTLYALHVVKFAGTKHRPVSLTARSYAAAFKDSLKLQKLFLKPWVRTVVTMWTCYTTEVPPAHAGANLQVSICALCLMMRLGCSRGVR